MKTNVTARLHEIEQPVLLIQGSRDIGVPVALFTELLLEHLAS